VAALLVAGATGGPYVLYETEVVQQAQQAAGSVWTSASGMASSASAALTPGSWSGGGSPTVTQSFNTSGNTQDLWNFNLGTPSVEQLQAAAPLPALTGMEVRDIREVLRFDITPQWVPQRFSRVSTVLADLNMDGLRVPLVTGTDVGDLAGTLTYYFDRFQRLQRVQIHALTGEPSRIVMQLQQFYHLQPEPALGGQLYLIKWNGKPTSVLHVAPAPIIYASAEHSRYSVFLELNQPEIPFGVSPEAVELIGSGRVTNRW
jgi:hypothetical protein